MKHNKRFHSLKGNMSGSMSSSFGLGLWFKITRMHLEIWRSKHKEGKHLYQIPMWSNSGVLNKIPAILMFSPLANGAFRELWESSQRFSHQKNINVKHPSGTTANTVDKSAFTKIYSKGQFTIDHYLSIHMNWLLSVGLISGPEFDSESDYEFDESHSSP